MTSKSYAEFMRSLRSVAPPVPAALANRLDADARVGFLVAQALSQNRIDFHYRPVVFASNPTLPAFHEMTPRLRLSDGSALPVEAYLEAVGGRELEREIDRLALRQALRVLEKNPVLRLCVGVSPGSMGDGAWLEIFDNARRTMADACGRLVFEVGGHTASHDPAQLADFMHYAREFGPAFAVKGCGSGGIGFGHLCDFRFDMVKIDASFIRGIDTNRDHQVLVECLQRLSLQFEMFSIAEGVETEAEARWLCDAGIDCMQGNFYAAASARAGLPPRTDGSNQAAG
jgi:EAL domain-containing protein (putative c-di-GMP-specific phosphodiesterase class I)